MPQGKSLKKSECRTRVLTLDSTIDSCWHPCCELLKIQIPGHQLMHLQIGGFGAEPKKLLSGARLCSVSLLGSNMADESQFATGETSEDLEEGWGRDVLREAPSKPHLWSSKKVSPSQTMPLACRRRGLEQAVPLW
jgi:hypothetical protein